jgi:MFS family permease
MNSLLALNSDTVPDGIRRPKARFVALLGADGISSVGNMITLVAVPWFVLQNTGSVSRTGIVTFFAALPLVIAGPVGGVFIDRLGTRLTSVIADALAGGCVAAIVVLHRAGRLHLWEIAVLVFLAGLMNVPAETSRLAVVPDAAAAAGISISRASSLRSGVAQTANLLGGPAAAAAITVFGSADALLVDAATFVISAVLICIAVPPKVTVTTTSSSLRGEFVVGVRFILHDHLLRAIGAMVVFMNFLDQAFFVVLVPVLARQLHYGPKGIGLMIGALGAGALTSTLLYTLIGDRLDRLHVLTLCLLVVGAPRYLVLSLSPPLVVAVAMMLLAGLSAGPINPILQTAMFRRIPTEMRGRVLGTFRSGAYAAIPLGGLVAGVAVSAIGLRRTLIAAAGMYVVATLTVTRPAWRGVNEAGAPDDAAPADSPPADAPFTRPPADLPPSADGR